MQSGLLEVTAVFRAAEAAHRSASLIDPFLIDQT
jgi:hypothetical protein